MGGGIRYGGFLFLRWLAIGDIGDFEMWEWVSCTFGIVKNVGGGGCLTPHEEVSARDRDVGSS